jgi:hypothetical protein
MMAICLSRKIAEEDKSLYNKCKRLGTGSQILISRVAVHVAVLEWKVKDQVFDRHKNG